MADNLENTGALDRALISLEQDHEVQYWTGALGVSVQKLKAIIEEVGHSAAAVRARLAQES